MNATTIETHPPLISIVFPYTNWKQEIPLLLVSSWLVALTARISIPLKPVPLTGQTFGVLFVAALLGRKRGTMTMITYLTEGALGLPVFAGGEGGILHLIGPTGGYLFGFIFAAFIVGWLCEKGWDRQLVSAEMAMFIGNILIYVCGLPWLANFIGWQSVLKVGFFPFIFSDLIKILLAGSCLPIAWFLFNRIESDPSLRSFKSPQ